MFVVKSGFEEPEEEKQSDSDAHRVEDDVAGRALAPGTGELMDFIENADYQGNSPRNKETDRQACRASGP